MIHNLRPYAAYKDSGVLWLGVLFGKWLTWCSTFGRLGNAGLSEEAIVVNDRLNSDRCAFRSLSTEREIVEKFERGELRPARGPEREMETARRAARSTFNKTRQVNLRVTERDFSLAHARARARAREEGIPYQTLLSSVIHKYLSGRLVEKG